MRLEDNIGIDALTEILAPHYIGKLRHNPKGMTAEEFELIHKMNPRLIGKIILDTPGGMTPGELKYLQTHCEEPFEHNWEHSHDWRDDVVDKYAEHIKNYYYNYKPEAQEIDPDIDPDEQHIGPMAQDIEKVNPAAVKETPEGVKTVDTDRLSLMNAGVIADLAREVNELKKEKGVPSDTGIKTGIKPTLKPSYKKPETLLSKMLWRKK
jgi:hypothetical protein